MLAPGAAGRVLSRALSLSHGLGSVQVERWWPVPLARAGAAPRLHPRRHRVFRLLRDGKHEPRGTMELLLSRAVPGLGSRGDLVSVPKRLGRNRLLPQGSALYPSPENLRALQEEEKLADEGKLHQEHQTPSGTKAVAFLRRCRLWVGMRSSASWELSPDIVARHFLKNLRVSVPPHALRLPEEPIRSWGHFWCDVTVNGLDTVRVPMEVGRFLHPKTRRARHRRQRLESGRERLQ